MNRAGTKALVSAGAAVALLLAGGGSSVAGGPSVAKDASAKPKGSHSYKLQHTDIDYGGDKTRFESQVKLADGRRVAMHYLDKKGLYVQDYSPKARGWSKPKNVYRTKTDVCQGITLKARAGTVAAIADWARYCYDGEPPMESIAAVATGRLTTWDRHLTKSFDGWIKAEITKNGKQVTFKRYAHRLKWTKGKGFGPKH
ncbi:hypothetical protein [Streptomyces sp. AN091965]|uniref:hypothetical protein n=1 Tax=Streptomyces sp. AN091965 TaxID=2927803 RepID=UPI001F622161|nr:hypothetical protein [Streptomyces sp. AN091965]MCI3929846.1 hypothetical protein [Streptomyces sp. AN091965]